MPPKGSTKANKVRCKVFEKSHATFANQSATTSTWTRLAGTSSGSVHYTMEKVAIVLEPPQKRHWTDEQGQSSPSANTSNMPSGSSTPVIDSPLPSTPGLITDPNGNSKNSTPASEKPTTPIKPYVSLLKPLLSSVHLQFFIGQIFLFATV